MVSVHSYLFELYNKMPIFFSSTSQKLHGTMTDSTFGKCPWQLIASLMFMTNTLRTLPPTPRCLSFALTNDYPPFISFCKMLSSNLIIYDVKLPIFKLPMSNSMLISSLQVNLPHVNGYWYRRTHSADMTIFLLWFNQSRVVTPAEQYSWYHTTTPRCNQGCQNWPR